MPKKTERGHVTRLCSSILRLLTLKSRDLFKITHTGMSELAKTQSESLLSRYVTSDMGRASMQQYPWIPKDMIERSDEVMAACNKLLEEWSINLEIRKPTIGGFGMFTKVDIKAGEILMTQKCPINVSTKQIAPPEFRPEWFNCWQLVATKASLSVMECCPTILYCNKRCQKIVREYYDIFHNKDDSHLYRAYSDARSAKGSDYSPEFTKLVFLRMLAVCVQGKVHPLKNPLFAGLMAHNHPDCTPEVPWTLDGHFIGPIHMLGEMGIDVFANSDYESWILEHLW
jgi:hypothetical protein